MDLRTREGRKFKRIARIISLCVGLIFGIGASILLDGSAIENFIYAFVGSYFVMMIIILILKKLL